MTSNIDSIEITQPDDWHIHLRDGAILNRVAPLSARQFGRVMVMPNLTPPITNVSMAMAYRDRILSACKATDEASKHFNALMSLYLTESTTIEDVTAAAQNENVVGFKLYPAGATTNSDSGVKVIENVYPIFEQMQKSGVILQIHGEVTHQDIDVFDREKVFIDKVLTPICQQFPELKIVFEHITTKDAVQFVEQSAKNIAATITPQHLMYSRNAIFSGGIRPHFYCLPILKRSEHQAALCQAAISGNPKFFLGTDSAPHTKAKKESDCGCAGIFSAATAIEFYTEVFDKLNALDKLEGFASFYGADFYHYPRNQRKIKLQRRKQTIAEKLTLPQQNNLPADEQEIIPFLAGEEINWQFMGIAK